MPQAERATATPTPAASQPAREPRKKGVRAVIDKETGRIVGADYVYDDEP